MEESVFVGELDDQDQDFGRKILDVSWRGAAQVNLHFVVAEWLSVVGNCDFFGVGHR